MNIASIFGRLSYVAGGYALSKYGIEAFSDFLWYILFHSLECDNYSLSYRYLN